jgi:hypothetical protein
MSRCLCHDGGEDARQYGSGPARHAVWWRRALLLVCWPERVSRAMATAVGSTDDEAETTRFFVTRGPPRLED